MNRTDKKGRHKERKKNWNFLAKKKRQGRTQAVPIRKKYRAKNLAKKERQAGKL